MCVGGGVSQAAPAETEEARVLNLRESLRMTIYTWVSRGLFERHKLIFLSQLTFNLMKRGILGESGRERGDRKKRAGRQAG